MMKEYSKALKYHLLFVELKPHNGDGYNALGLDYYYTRDYKNALKYLKLAKKNGFNVQESLLDRLEKIVK